MEASPNRDDGRPDRAGPRSRAKREIDLLTPEEVRAVLNSCSRRSVTGVRNRGLFAIMYGAGLRVSEAISLRVKDLDLDRLTVVIQSGKLGKRRVAGLLPDAVDPAQRWLDRRAQLGVGPRDPLFCTVARGASGSRPTRPGGRIAREHVARVLKRLALKVGIAKRVHCHVLRHSHADLLRRRGFDMEEIRRQLGHATLDVTGRYLDHLGSNDLPDKMRAVGGVLVDEKDPRDELAAFLAGLKSDDAKRLVELLARCAS